jgi:hypothetical protein
MNNPVNNVPPEIFPIVASFLPLHATPSTLLSLALANRHIHSIILPILYSCLILKNENHALKFLQKLLDEPEFGKVVREIYILSGLSLATRNGENPFDVLRGLEMVIAAGSLPYIHTLGLHLLAGWHYDDEFRPIDGFGQLSSEFCESLRKNCPRLRGLVIRDIADIGGIDMSGLLEIQVSMPQSRRLFLTSVQDITNLTLNTRGLVSKRGGGKLMKRVESLCNSLHTLSLDSNSTTFSDSAFLMFSLYFPYLRSLSLELFVIKDVNTAMAFWKRHPTLEFLKVVTLERMRWFTNELPSEFLPNLRHLRVSNEPYFSYNLTDYIFQADFTSVRALAPILHQLVSLAVFATVNAQVPYLIRSVLPEGLPNLKSLNIGQSASASANNINVEGGLWYETQDGKFMEQAKVYRGFLNRGFRRVSEGYMHSIARGAPNLEEIGFFSYTVPLSDFVSSFYLGAGLFRSSSLEGQYRI